MADRTQVAALGDSITAGTPLWDPNPDVRAKIAQPDERSQWMYWFVQANPSFQFSNHGVDLQQTHEIAERLETAAAGADVLIIQGGINDLVNGKTPATAADSLREMVRHGKTLVGRVRITELIPNNNFPDFEEPIRELNRRISVIASDEAIPLLPFFAALESPDRPGRMRAADTDDGNHPSLSGHQRLGGGGLPIA